MLDFLTLVIVLGVPTAAVLFTRRSHRPAPAVYTMHVATRGQAVDPTPDLRTGEQKVADQERVNRLGFPRGACA